MPLVDLASRLDGLLNRRVDTRTGRTYSIPDKSGSKGFPSSKPPVHGLGRQSAGYLRGTLTHYVADRIAAEPKAQRL